MKTQLLPYYFKKPGLILFAIMCLPSVTTGFMDGMTGDKYTIISERAVHVMDVIGIVGIAMYALSKEKVYDELLHRLKLEAMKVTFIVSLVTMLLVHILFPELKLNPSYLINLQVFCFIGVYHLKKENIVASACSVVDYE